MEIDALLIEKPATVLFTLAFLMPGFITMCVLGLFVPPRRTETSAAVLRLLMLSLGNYAVCFPLVAWVLLGSYFVDHKVALCLVLACIGFVFPALLGVLIGIGGQKDWVGKALGRLGLSAIHPVPVSWDYAFGGRTGHVYVRVTLKDGAVWAGRFGPASFASSYPDGNDLLLEAVYEVGEDGAWAEHPTTQSLLIASGEIRSVEFIKPEPQEEPAHEQRQEEDSRLRTPAQAGLEPRPPAQGVGARERAQASLGQR